MPSSTPIADIRLLAPEKIAIVGDWHGHSHAAHARAVVKAASEAGIELMIHVGDLGYRFAHPEYVGFDAALDAILAEYAMTLIWVDGNHENHGLLKSLALREDGLAVCDDHGRILYSPRGAYWDWRGLRFGTLGGARTVNGHRLQEGVSVFSKLELISDADVERLGLAGKLDVLIAHDSPATMTYTHRADILPLDIEVTDSNRAKLQRAIELCRPSLFFGGHWHVRREELHWTGEHSYVAHVLDREGRVGNAVVLELATLQVTELASDSLVMEAAEPQHGVLVP